MSEPSTFDVHATIGALFVYPIKSCAGVQVQEAILTETGLELDRAWMVVDQHGEFVTQRDLPRMALIVPQLKYSEMVVRAPGMLALHIQISAVESACRATVWGHDCAAYDMGDVAAQWLSDFLNQELPSGYPAQKLRLVRFDPEHRRLSDKKWTGEIDALNQFADGYPLLVLSQAAVDELNTRIAASGHSPVSAQRFRPNIVLEGAQAHDEDRWDALHIDTPDGVVELPLVKPCARCSIPNVDPQTALSDVRLGDTLQSYRTSPRMDGAITFGMNAAIRQGFECTLRVGQSVSARWQF